MKTNPNINQMTMDTVKQPNSKHCFVCGRENAYGLKLNFYETAPGEVIVNYTVPEHFQGYPGVVHGGIVAAMLDEVTGRVHMGGDPPRFMFTAKLNIRYRKNVPIGQPLRIIGHAGKSKGRMAVATGEIFGPDDELLAEAEALLINVPDQIVDQVDLENIGWKVYPD
jgi:acyl-coenzyme A thioesterase PaaI-like protein